MGPVHCSLDPQTSFFNNFFIKNGSHGTIHTFKNYFAIVFLVFSFQFSMVSKWTLRSTEMSDYFWTKPRYPDLKTHCDFNNVPHVCTNLLALVDFEERFKSSYLNLYLIFLLDSKFCLFAFLSQSLAFQNKIGETFYLFIFK